MRDRLIIALTLLGMFAVVFAFIGPAACEDPPPEPDAAPPPDRGPPDAFIEPDAMEPDAFSVNDETLTLEQVKTMGMVDRPARLLEAWFADQPYWTRDPRSPAPTWVNQNGVRLSFKVRGGKVVSTGAEFPENAVSADLTALSEFMVGQQDALPLRFEKIRPGDVVPTSGGFEDRNGRKFYFRGRLSAEPPYGPAEFEIRTSPWPGQSPEVLTFEQLNARDAPLDVPPSDDPIQVNPPANADTLPSQLDGLQLPFDAPEGDAPAGDAPGDAPAGDAPGDDQP